MTPRGDPWRLCCPACGSVTWRTASDHYTCVYCSERFERLLDKKTGELATLGVVG